MISVYLLLDFFAKVLPERLWNENKSDLEIANFFGVKEITIKSYRTRGENAGKFTRNDYFSEKDLKLSNEQEQCINFKNE